MKLRLDQSDDGRLDIGLAVLIALFTLALIPRVAIALWLPAEIVWLDGERYVQVALNLLNSGGFGSLRDNQLSVPTQPVVIATSFALFGQGYLALRLVMAVMGSLTCVLGYIITRQIFGQKTAVITGLILCFYPYLIYLSALFEYPQPLFVFLISIFFVLYFRWDHSRSLTLLAVAGVVLGLAVLTVPTALIFLVAVGALLLDRDTIVTLRRLAVFFVAALLPIGTWAARNYDEYGHWVLFNAAGGFSLWQANNNTYLKHGKRAIIPPCASGYENSEFCVEYSGLAKRLGDATMPDVERILEFDRIANQKAWKFILQDPIATLALSLRKLAEMWSPVPNAVTKGEAQGGRFATWISIATYTPLLVLAVLGALRGRSMWRRLLPLYLYILTMAGPYCLFLPTTRYRLPIDFVLAIFAAYGLVSSRAWGLAAKRVALLSRVG